MSKLHEEMYVLEITLAKKEGISVTSISSNVRKIVT